MLLDRDLHDYEARIVVSSGNEAIAIVRDITERKQAEADMRVTLAKEKRTQPVKVALCHYDFS